MVESQIKKIAHKKEKKNLNKELEYYIRCN